jgi:predicted dinucleotide-binding enzyme
MSFIAIIGAGNLGGTLAHTLALGDRVARSG